MVHWRKHSQHIGRSIPLYVFPDLYPSPRLTPTARIINSTTNSVIYGLEVLSGIDIGCYGQAGFAVAQRLVPAADIHRAISLMLIGKSHS